MNKFRFYICRIDADYKKHVEGQKDAFLDNLRPQLAAVLNTNEDNIRHLDCKSGSIMVFFRLVGVEDEAGELIESYSELAKLIGTGTWSLVRLHKYIVYLIVIILMNIKHYKYFC